METKQFTFTHLGWILSDDTVLNLRGALAFVQSACGINWRLITDLTGTRLEITGFDTVLSNRIADDEPITFLKKIRYTEKSTDELALDTDYAIDDDRLIIVIINSEMKVTVKEMAWNGEILDLMIDSKINE